MCCQVKSSHLTDMQWDLVFELSQPHPRQWMCCQVRSSHLTELSVKISLNHQLTVQTTTNQQTCMLNAAFGLTLMPSIAQTGKTQINRRERHQFSSVSTLEPIGYKQASTLGNLIEVHNTWFTTFYGNKFRSHHYIILDQKVWPPLTV